MKQLLIIVAILAVAFVGYTGYRSIVEEPPDFLIKLFTKTPPPLALPAGDVAPFDVPPGFALHIYSRDVPGARVMTRDSSGTMLVSLTQGGKVVALPDENGDGKADSTVTVLQDLNKPHGLAVICRDECLLYVAEEDALTSYTYDAEKMSATDAKQLMTFPAGRGHFTRTILQHPDNERLLISVGSSCNVCYEEHIMRASVVAYHMTTGATSIFASGLRNTVFMALHPTTGDVWGTDNGRDLIGDDIPPDEVNIIDEGGNYGWPICYGQKIHDTDFDTKQYFRDPCFNTIAPEINLPAHSAALGIAFIPEEGWPEEYWHDALVAFHGSWNRSTPTGYKVVRIHDGVLSDFITGFLTGDNEDDALGRPAGVMTEPGGVAYISDDRAGAIYRLSLTE